ncbi:hypothetical protein Syun_022219 [Stephania yunnanensis]|uniref:Uncharacterized protein n=1 Tax=Stephania yunnanensis TaxID=152371 RepID=A0AAP0IHF7_9MAGN
MEQQQKMFLLSLIFFTSFVSLVSSNTIVPAIFTFGDSIFDAGTNHFNKNCSVQADFLPYGRTFFHYPTGRFTNGRTVVDFISQFLVIDLQKPYLQTEMEIANGTRKRYPSNGINFASAGSGVLNGTNKDMGVLSIQDQLKQFKNLVNQNKIDKKLIQQAFFFFESGSNDVFNYFLPFDTAKLDPGAFVQTMLTEAEHFIDQICQLGAHRIAIFSLGPVGCVPARVNLPEAPTDKCYGKMNKIVKAYNAGLENLAKSVPSKYPGTVATYGDVYKVVQLFRAMPKHYGFSNTTGACCGDGTLGGFVQCGTGEYTMCNNPNEYLFWDYFHPSEHSYKLISKALWAGNTRVIRPLNLKNMSNIAVVLT